MEMTKGWIGNTADIKKAKYINMNRWATLYLRELLKDIAEAHEGKVTSKNFSRAQSKPPFQLKLDHRLSE